MLPNHTGLYYTTILRGIGLGLISLFIPIYIYRSLGSFTLVFSFYALHHLVVILSSYPTGLIVNRLGVDISGFIGGILHSLFFLLLIAGQTHPACFIPAMIIWGLSIPFTWLSYNYYLSSGDHPRLGRRVAFLLFINRWLGAITPLVGGILLNFGGFNLVYLLALVIFYIGRSLDNKKKAGYFRPAVIINSLNLFCRGFISAAFPLFILETIYHLGAIFIWIPFNAKVYAAARAEKRLEFFIRREWLIHGGGFVASLALVLFFAFGTHWGWVFGLGAVSLFAVASIST